MAQFPLSLVAVLMLLGQLPAAEELPAAANLLDNPGFERGDAVTAGWRTFSPAPRGVRYAIDSERRHSGRRSAMIESTAAGTGMWQQVVDVEPQRVYVLAGYVAFEQVDPGGRCCLQLVFRNSRNQILQFVYLPGHTGTRQFALDFPALLKVRAPAGAARAEVNLFLRGAGKAWFDDVIFAPAPTGEISGTVTCAGKPMEGARVFLWGDPWGRPCEATTDADGRYRLRDVPVAFPRYVVLASKSGYRTAAAGDVAVTAEGNTIVNFELAPGADPDELRVKFGTLFFRRFVPPRRIPPGAVIPADAEGYPESVRPYLKADRCIQSDHPAVRAKAKQLQESLALEQRRQTEKVAWAIYEWVSRHIEHDGVYAEPPAGLDQPYCDVTSGIWQTISGRGWCWGKNFYDWCYRPNELLETQAGICVEHAWLVAAMLRSLNIPARAAVGSLEFWAQDPRGNGAWIHMSTTGGRTSFRQHGRLGPGFGGGPPEVRYSVLSRPILHEDWNAPCKGLWRERHPWGERYRPTPAGYRQAKTDLEEFSASGRAPKAPRFKPLRPSDLSGGDTSPSGTAAEELFDLAVQRRHGGPHPGDCYQIFYSDVTISLLTMTDRRTLDVRFPLPTEPPGETLRCENAYWTNHPECVRRTWIQRISNPPVPGTERWFHIEFDLTSLFSRGSELPGSSAAKVQHEE